MKSKKLIEVAIPIKEISAESVRDKSIRHGHISTLHLWWARRPLPVCRAVIFASLIPDPLDEHCPQVFRDAVEQLLGKKNNPGDPYKPYSDIPWTPILDPMEDNLRNRLQMFIGKFSEDAQKAMIHNKPLPPAGKMLSDSCLIKWDNKNNEKTLSLARKLIFVAHNSENASVSLDGLLSEYNQLYSSITESEKQLFGFLDRHILEKSSDLERQLQTSIDAFLDKMPRVFDPFAGGGAIPLEASRLGCRSFGNDINPVAHIIQKGSLEFPQKYGKPILYSLQEFAKLYFPNQHWSELQFASQNMHSDLYTIQSYEDFEKIEILTKRQEFQPIQRVLVTNRLSFDVEYWAKYMLKEAEKEIGQYYPIDEKTGQPPIAYYWARVATCTNPACRAEVPLLKGFYLANTKTKQVYLKPIIRGTHIDFEIASGKCDQEGWMGSALTCPCCGSLTDVKKIKEQSKNSLHSDSIDLLSGNPYKMKERLLAVIVDGKNGKEYRIPTQEELDVAVIDKEKLRYDIIPHEKMKEIPDLVSGRGWGIDQWSQMFSNRQLIAMQTLVKKVKEVQGLLHKEEYANAIITYMGIWVDKISSAFTVFGRWNSARETVDTPFSKQAIPMIFDYPESNPFAGAGGGALNQLEWLTRYIESECSVPFSVQLYNASSGDKSQFQPKFLTATITDPPYYDAIAYADLSDFFYVWLKRTVGEIYPDNFLTPQTPKLEECTALKHHHDNSKEKAFTHFERKLTEIFSAIEHQTSGIIGIMFAHQSTEAWTTLCNSIIAANMNITGSWAIDTEREARGIALAGAALGSSVTVACRPIVRQALGDYKKVRKAIETTIQQQVKELYTLGFRGADLLTACFGLAVGEAGKYTHVEKTDGTEVTIAYLLEMTKEIAFNSLLKGFDGDDFTKFYIGWLQLYSFTETDFDDAAKFSRVGLSINVAELFSENILVKKGNRQTPATYTERIKADKNLGKNGSNCRILLDIVHKIMHLFEKGDRKELIEYIAKTASSQDSNVWRVLTALCEVLPKNSTDFQQASGLLAVKDNLIRASKETEERLL